MKDPRTLRRLHDELRNIARELTQPIERTIIRDNRTTEKTTVPSLLDQLRDEIAPDGARGGRGGGRGTPVPISVEASDLLTRIIVDARRLYVEAYAVDHNINAAEAEKRVPHADVEGRIRGIASITGRWADVERVRVAADYLASWRTSIMSFLDPTQISVPAPCPECDTRMVWQRDDTGHRTQVFALTYDPLNGCKCLNCGSTWPTTHMKHLARVIDTPTLEHSA